MAIGTPVVGAAAGTWANNAAVTPTAPAGYAVGDLLVVVWCARASQTPSSNPPSGWSSGPGFANANSSIWVYYKVAASTSETMPSITKSSITGLTVGVICFAVSGVDTTTPFHVSPGSADVFTNNASNSGTLSAQTTSRDGALAFYVQARNNDYTGAAAATTGWTELWDGSSTLGTDGGMSGGYKSINPAGTTGTADVAITGGVSTDDGIGFIFVLNPAVTTNVIAATVSETVTTAGAIDKSTDIATAAQAETVSRDAAVDKTTPIATGALTVTSAATADITVSAAAVTIDAAATATEAASAAIAKSTDLAAAQTGTVTTAGAVAKSSDIAAAATATESAAAAIAKTSTVATSAQAETVGLAGAIAKSTDIATAAQAETVTVAGALSHTVPLDGATTATVASAADIAIASSTLDVDGSTAVTSAQAAAVAKTSTVAADVTVALTFTAALDGGTVAAAPAGDGSGITFAKPAPTPYTPKLHTTAAQAAAYGITATAELTVDSTRRLKRERRRREEALLMGLDQGA